MQAVRAPGQADNRENFANASTSPGTSSAGKAGDHELWQPDFRHLAAVITGYLASWTHTFAAGLGAGSVSSATWNNQLRLSAG
jgi:hypothetical protein